jgi:hypothetical protein
MNPTKMKFCGNCRYPLGLACAISLVFFAAVIVMMIDGCGQLTQFSIKNATSGDVEVTSGHTQKTVRIPDQKTALVPHTSGDITVTLPDGRIWVYKNLSPLDLKGTPFMVEKHYLFFGYQDGYIFRGSWTVNLLLSKDSRLYVIPPNAKDVDVEKLKQPKGFPVKPQESRNRKAGQNDLPATQ